MSASELAADVYLLAAALGLVLAVGRAGMPVLGQGAFVAVGSFGVVLLGPGHLGLPLPVAALGAVAIAASAGWLVAFSAARLDGPFLALATWGLAWLVSAGLDAFPKVSGGAQGLIAPSPARVQSRWLGLTLTLTPTVHLVVAAVVGVLALLLVAAIDRGPAGLDLAAMREGPAVAASLGIPVGRRRRAVLATAAALGAVTGVGLVELQGVVAPADVSPLLSVQLFAAVLIGGTVRWWGPVAGVVVLSALPHLADGLRGVLGGTAAAASGVLTAVVLLAAVVARDPLDRLLSRRLRRPKPLVAAPASAQGPAVVRREVPVLSAQGIAASYEGLSVLEDVSLEVRPGEVHALLGPNGSGKTTLLRILAGSMPCDRGTIVLGGQDVTGLDQVARVRAGLVRTFQRTVLLERLTPHRQVAAGARVARGRPYAVLRALVATPLSQRESTEIHELTEDSLRLTGLDMAATPGRALVHGQQRLLQVARALATDPAVILLDEPGAGMTAGESAELADVVRAVAATGRGVLLVEHDMRLVAKVADRVTVLADGRVLASGTPAEVRRDPHVEAAYLGALDRVL